VTITSESGAAKASNADISLKWLRLMSERPIREHAYIP
jgi:hypothetical protein